MNLYNPNWRANSVSYITAGQPNQLVLKATMTSPNAGQVMGWHSYIADRIINRGGDSAAFDHLVVRGRSGTGDSLRVRVALITKDAQAFATTLTLGNQLSEVEIPLTALVKDSALLLPRPYPGFLPLWFTSSATTPLRLSEVDKLEVSFRAGEATKPVELQVESIQLKRRK
jgi:hypothetical protein